MCSRLIGWSENRRQRNEMWVSEMMTELCKHPACEKSLVWRTAVDQLWSSHTSGLTTVVLVDVRVMLQPT